MRVTLVGHKMTQSQGYIQLAEISRGIVHRRAVESPLEKAAQFKEALMMRW
jgi:hypothetical protein